MIIYMIIYEAHFCLFLGLCGIIGPSIYANQIVASFMMTTYNPNYGGMNQMQMEEMGMGGMGGMGMSTVNR